MKKRYFLGAAALLALLAVPQAQAADTAEQELIKLEQQMLDGVLRGDMSLFRRTVVPGYVFTTPDGKVQGAAELEADMKSGKFKLLASQNLDMQVHIHGSTAVVLYRSVDKGIYEGQQFEGENRWTDVFVKQGKGWRMVASQGTALPPAPPAPAKP